MCLIVDAFSRLIVGWRVTSAPVPQVRVRVGPGRVVAAVADEGEPARQGPVDANSTGPPSGPVGREAHRRLLERSDTGRRLAHTLEAPAVDAAVGADPAGALPAVRAHVLAGLDSHEGSLRRP